MGKLLITLIAAAIIPLTLASVANASVNTGNENIVGEKCSETTSSNYYANACSNCPDNSLCLFENERFNRTERGKEGAIMRFTRDQLLGSTNILTLNGRQVRCTGLKYPMLIAQGPNRYSRVSSVINRTHKTIHINSWYNCSGKTSLTIPHYSSFDRLSDFSFDNRTFSVAAPLK